MPAVRRRQGELRFALAESADDAAIRRLLRENPTRGAISVSFEREPNYFAEVGRVSDPPCRATSPADEEGRSETCPTVQQNETIVAYESGRLVCMGRCSVRLRYLNGELCRVGYLGELRLDSSSRRRVEILRGGYRLFRELQGSNPADLYFTSVASDNVRARRVLERGLPDLPRYEFLTEFVTLLVPVGPVDCRPSAPVVGRAGTPLSAAARTECPPYLNAHAARHQLAAHWSESDFDDSCDLITLRDQGGRILGAAAFWDQRAWRQTVVRGYSRGLAVARPFVNVAASLFGGPRLPRVGSVLGAAFLSPLATTPGHESRLPELIRAAFAPARARGVDLLTVGFAANDSRLAIVRRHFRCREYRSRLYRVVWPEDTVAGVACLERSRKGDPGLPTRRSGRPATTTLDTRPFLPEVALL